MPSFSPSRPIDQDLLALDERVAGVVERITFHSDDSGFCVLQVRARGHRRPVTVIGHVPSVSIGEFVEAKGSWANHPSHGVQFQAELLAASSPTEGDDLGRFLASGLIRGVGPALARRLLAAFGSRVLEVIERSPEEVARVRGIGPNRARIIAEAWAEHRSMRQLSAFLGDHGIGGALLMRIHRTYGRDAIDVISANPYRLALDLPDFDFLAADRLAAGLKIGRCSKIRLQAGITSVMADGVDSGHCGLPADQLAARTSRRLRVPVAELDGVIDAQCAEGDLVAETIDGQRCLFPRGLHRAEQFIAKRLRDLSRGALPWRGIEPRGAILRAEEALGIALSRTQREALTRICQCKVLVVTGGPGVGKTTLVRAILHVLGGRNVSVALCAPTGRAARRLTAATGREATTVHRLLGASKAGPGLGDAVALDCGLLVVDEASMVDVRLMAALLRALPDNAGLLILGDVDQLPSIGPGQVLSDILRSGAVPVVRLQEVFRQEAASRIVTAAHAINRGHVPDLEPQAGSDFYFVDAAGPDAVLAKLVTLVRDRIPRRFGLDPIQDIQVLCPVNRGPLGAGRLNSRLQAALNPPNPSALVRAGWSFGIGDKVMQVRNDYERDVSNGELGTVRSVELSDRQLVVGFDERLVTYGADDLDALTLAYATTIHKAQGSEFPAVVIPVVPQHARVLRRSLLYTAVTRASRLAILVGCRATLSDAVARDESCRRWSRLDTWLREADREFC